MNGTRSDCQPVRVDGSDEVSRESPPIGGTADEAKARQAHGHAPRDESTVRGPRRRLLGASALLLGAHLGRNGAAHADPLSAAARTARTARKTPAMWRTWQEVAISDMRRPDGSYARNDDGLLLRTQVSYSSQNERASLVMGRYGTAAAFTAENPDYKKELSWVEPDDPARKLRVWPRIIAWDQVYLGERYGADHAPGYKGNSRVNTWGYELWVRRHSGTWRRLFRSDRKTGEAWRPTFRGHPRHGADALDLRVEPDGSTSVRPLPVLGLDASGSYWVPHGYTGLRAIESADVADILVRCYSALILHDPDGPDDRRYARFLLAVGADWYPPDNKGWSMYPGVGTSRHKYVTVEPSLHVMHTMTPAEFRADPPPLQP